MLLPRTLTTLAAGLAFGVLAATAIADSPNEAKATDAKAAGENAEMQPAKPGPEHARLASMAGKWKVVQKSMFDPSKPPEISQGTEVCTLICNGLFLRSEYHVKDKNGDFYGSGLVGYDTMKKRYTGNWVDSWSTMQFPYEGTCEGNKCMYTMQVPGQDGQMVTATLVTEEVDKDHRTFAMSVPGPDGKTVPMMQLTYTRQ
jgi:hypothetical protein